MLISNILLLLLDESNDICRLRTWCILCHPQKTMSQITTFGSVSHDCVWMTQSSRSQPLAPSAKLCQQGRRVNCNRHHLLPGEKKRAMVDPATFLADTSHGNSAPQFEAVGKLILCRPPITMTFNVPMFSASPLRVLYLRISEKSGYPVEKWVRKVCKAGGYACRIK